MKRIIFPLVIVAVLVIMVPLAANLPPATVAQPEPLYLECLPDESFTTTVGNVTNFEAGASGGEPPYDWLWTVNGDPVASLNNTFSTYNNYTHAFNEPGLYTVCVNVTDSLDNKAQCCKNATVVGPSLIIAKIDAPDPVNAGGTLNYTITVTNNGTANATNVTIVDDYDENTLTIVNAGGGNVSDPANNVTWNGNLTIPVGDFLSYNISAIVSANVTGNYTFDNTANVTCAEGVSSSISINTTVMGALNLTCHISPNPTKIGHVTNFTANATGGVPPYSSWLWTVNGTKVSEDQNTTYNFTAGNHTAGIYNVCVNVTDSSGNWTPCCTDVTVNPPLFMECKVSPNVTKVDQAINCTAGASGGVPPYSWLWTVNGTNPISFNNTASTNITCTFNLTGVYEVCVNVTDYLGNEHWCCNNVTVTGALNLTCHISPNPTKIGHVTNFTANATGGVPPYSSWLWTVNGTKVSEDQNTTYNFTAVNHTAGVYNVCVNVTDLLDDKAQCCTNVTVNPPLSLECNVGPTTIKVGNEIDCMAGASGGVGNYTWLWTVNGTEVSNNQNITYNFTAGNHTAGIYNVCVNVTDSLGNKKQCCTNVTVNPALTLVLSPKTATNLVGTFHLITATLYDQFDDPMPGMNLTWSIIGVGNFSGTPGDITNGAGQAYTEITSSTAGTSIVTCAVVGNPSVSDTATKTWIIPKRPSGGGGGGCPPIKYLTVDWDGKNTTRRLRSNDELALDLLGPSPDSRHSLLLEQDTHAPVVDGETYYLITIRELEDIPPLPENTEAIMAFDVTPTGAVFNKDIFLTLGFYQSQLPEDALEETTTIAYYGDVSGWVPLESTQGERDGMLTLSVAIDHLNIFAVLIEVAPSPPSPAHFVASGLSIETSEEKIWETITFVTKTGENVAISSNVANDGGEEGTYTVELKLDGETVDTETVLLSAGLSHQVSFTVSGLDYGQHEVEVDGLSGEFTTSRTVTWWLIIVIIVVIGLIIWGVIWFRRRRKSRRAT